MEVLEEGKADKTRRQHVMQGKTEKILKTVLDLTLFVQNTYFLRLEWVASKSQKTRDTNLSKCFSWLGSPLASKSRRKLRICKVEFIQPSNWLYSVPNLLVFQHLVTLYLGRFVVRVVSEIEWSLLKSVQENRDSWLGLTGDSRLQATKRSTRAKHAGRWIVMLAGALQDKTGQLTIRLSRDWISRLSPAASHPCFVNPDVSHSSPTPV